MATEVHAGLSGSGKIVFTAAGLTYGFRCALSALGNSEPKEIAAYPRLHRVGFVAAYEYDETSHPGELTEVGPYIREPIWVQFGAFTFFTLTHAPLEPTGIDGFIYFFYPGITADISWYY